MNQREYLARLERAPIYNETGKILKSVGLIFEAHLPGAKVGSICRIGGEDGSSINHESVQAEVVGFRDKRALLMAFDDAIGVHSDSRVKLEQEVSQVLVGKALLGRVLNARGEPIDGKGPLKIDDGLEARSLYQKPTHPLEREVIRRPLDLGVRAINGLLTCGRGQRVGIMAGSGVGKSVLLGMMARRTTADVNVIALIGERGREVREFIERDLGPEGLARSVVIVATSDQSPLLRMRGAFLAATIAEYFRDEHQDVLLLMDSVTRFCMAQREIGLSMGEPPASKGYTPSVFSTLPKLLERAGTGISGGSITGLFTVLVEGDDMDDPIADSARSILDGHIVLSRKIAQRNHFPAIDVLASASRVMSSVSTPEHKKWAAQVKEWMALYKQVEDLLNLGAYSKGSNPKIDTAIAVHDRIDSLLRQGIDESGSLDETLAQLHSIVRAAESTS
ncbi:MAG: FliI/YscN family ATPase [Bdellovibrionales bacterium]|nr:FliI/YscN family ATPase [Bdellovibrionales bacterium]